MRRLLRRSCAVALIGMIGLFTDAAIGRDLADVRKSGVLRHLGVTYANFVTGAGDGLDVELIQGFAEHLGVRYEFVPTSWNDAYGDLTGVHAKHEGDRAMRFGVTPVRGDLIASGVSIVDWRSQVVHFSDVSPGASWIP